MADPALHQAIASAVRRCLVDLDAGRWPQLDAYLAEHDPLLEDYPPDDDRDANAVWNMAGSTMEQFWTGSPDVDSMTPAEALRHLVGAVECLERDIPIEDPVVLSYADRHLRPRPAEPPKRVQRRRFGDRE